MIDEASMWMLDWMVSGEEPFDAGIARRILGDGAAYEAFLVEVNEAKAERESFKTDLLAAAAAAEAGQAIDTTGMSDEQFRALVQGDPTGLGFFDTATNLSPLDPDSDVGC